jgi:cell division protein FtsB
MVWRVVTLPFRLLAALSKNILASLFLLALALSVAAVSSDSIFERMSGLVEAVSPDLSVRSRQARLLAAETGRADAEAKRADAAVAVAADLKERNAVLSQNNDALTATNTALKQQGDTLTQANAALTAENRGLQVEAAKASVNFQGRLIPAAEAVAEAARRLAGRVIAGSARQIAAAPGEAIPFYGIPIIAAEGGQALEDDCAALRDLHGLDVAFNATTALNDGGVCGLSMPDATALWAAVRNDAPALWQKLGAHFEGLPPLALPDWWKTVLSLADGLLAPMPQVTAKP